MDVWNIPSAESSREEKSSGERSMTAGQVRGRSGLKTKTAVMGYTENLDRGAGEGGLKSEIWKRHRRRWREKGGRQSSGLDRKEEKMGKSLCKVERVWTEVTK